MTRAVKFTIVFMQLECLELYIFRYTKLAIGDLASDEPPVGVTIWSIHMKLHCRKCRHAVGQKSNRKDATNKATHVWSIIMLQGGEKSSLQAA